MPVDTARLLSMAVVERRNILVAGGTSSGKTTLANALLAEMAGLDERVIIIEDTRELQCAASDVVAVRTRSIGPSGTGAATMADLVSPTIPLHTHRLNQDTVRGCEAPDLLQIWKTREPGANQPAHSHK